MTTKKKHISELHFEHKLWKAKLGFYKEEIAIYKNRLAEVSSKNSSPEIKQKVEQYQNKFIIQKDENDKLMHAINVHEDELAQMVKDNPVAWDHRLVEVHEGMDFKFSQYEKLFSELKEEFNRFVADNL